MRTALALISGHKVSVYVEVSGNPEGAHANVGDCDDYVGLDADIVDCNRQSLNAFVFRVPEDGVWSLWNDPAQSLGRSHVHQGEPRLAREGRVQRTGW